MEKALPAIPAKRYFTIGEVSDLCGVKPYVLRYWEQEFTQLKPMKRRGNRRYYQHHEVLLIRRIRELLYEQGFTISGARNRLTELVHSRSSSSASSSAPAPAADAGHDAELDGELDAMGSDSESPIDAEPEDAPIPQPVVIVDEVSLTQMRDELLSIRHLLVA
jgi:DNA-binding transcriptional MerR regulator